VSQIVFNAVDEAMESVEARIDKITGGKTTYAVTPEISELQGAHVALWELRRALQNLMRKSRP
jgi:hypothetical protein